MKLPELAHLLITTCFVIWVYQLSVIVLDGWFKTLTRMGVLRNDLIAIALAATALFFARGL